jgi:dienelactone hydrolase
LHRRFGKIRADAAPFVVGQDPWVEAEEVEALRDAVGRAEAAFEEHTYPGSGHLFTDPDLPEYDRASSEAMWRRVLAFLDRAGARS